MDNKTEISLTMDKKTETVPSNSNTGITSIGASIAILIIRSTILIIIVILIWTYKRRPARQNLNTDSSYSTLSRGSGLQVQPQPLQHDSAQLYDQIYFSPFTGWTEYIPKSETANIMNNPSQISQYSHPTYSIAGDDITEHSSTLNAANQAITSQLSSQKAHESTSEQPTYAAVDKSKKKFKKNEDSKT